MITTQYFSQEATSFPLVFKCGSIHSIDLGVAYVTILTNHFVSIFWPQWLFQDCHRAASIQCQSQNFSKAIGQGAFSADVESEKVSWQRLGAILSREAAWKWNQNRIAESRNVETSLLMILLEHLNLAVPEADIFNCQPINSLYIWSQFRVECLSPRLEESWLTWLQTAGKSFKYLRSGVARLSAYAWEKNKSCTESSFKSWPY